MPTDPFTSGRDEEDISADFEILFIAPHDERKFYDFFTDFRLLSSAGKVKKNFIKFQG